MNIHTAQILSPRRMETPRGSTSSSTSTRPAPLSAALSEWATYSHLRMQGYRLRLSQLYRLQRNSFYDWRAALDDSPRPPRGAAPSNSGSQANARPSQHLAQDPGINPGDSSRTATTLQGRAPPRPIFSAPAYSQPPLAAVVPAAAVPAAAGSAAAAAVPASAASATLHAATCELGAIAQELQEVAHDVLASAGHAGSPRDITRITMTVYGSDMTCIHPLHGRRHLDMRMTACNGDLMSDGNKCCDVTYLTTPRRCPVTVRSYVMISQRVARGVCAEPYP
jgi:hypothetical protein